MTAFVKVPDELLFDPDLSPEALKAYLVLVRYARMQSSDTFELTGDTLGTLLGRSRDSADRHLGELQRRGLVAIEGNRGRARPNLITVLDPQGVVFAGLHVERASADLPKEASADLRKPASADLRKPYKKEERTRADRGGEENRPLPSVDNGGAARTPRRPRCDVHEAPGSWSDSTQCRGCVADAKAADWSRSPAF